MAGTPYLVDSNILLRWVKPDHNDYPLVVSAIDAILRGNDVLCYTSQTVGAFWNTCTRPLDRNGYALSPQETDRRAKHFEEKLRLLPDSLAVHEEWRKLLVTYGVSGVQVHDARLAAAMRVHGVKRILTFNDRDFSRYRDIEAVQPINSFVDKGCSPGATPSSFELGPFGCRIIRRLRSCPRNLSAKLRLALGCECGCLSVPTGTEPSNISNNWLGVLCSRSR